MALGVARMDLAHAYSDTVLLGAKPSGGRTTVEASRKQSWTRLLTPMDASSTRGVGMRTPDPYLPWLLVWGFGLSLPLGDRLWEGRRAIWMTT